MSNWFHKYRPKTLDEYIFRDENLKNKVEQWIADPASMPHLVLYGTPGTGKTSLARILANEIGVEESDFSEYNAAKDNGVQMVRDLEDSFLQYGGWSKIRIVLLDEAHRLSDGAKSALLNMMETHIDSVRFIMTTNHVEKLNFAKASAVGSRCIFKALDTLDEDHFIAKIGNIMNIEMPDNNEDDHAILADIFNASFPDMRKCINLMQDCCVDGHFVPLINVASEGNGDYTEIDGLIKSGNFDEIRQFIAALSEDRIEPVYKYLYQNSKSLFGDLEPEAIKYIGEHLVNHPTVSYPEINLAACFAYLITLE